MKRYLTDRKYVIVLQIVIGLISLTTCIAHNLPVWHFFSSYLFQLICVYLFGNALLTIFRVEFKNDIARCVYSYATGLAMLIPEYYLSQLLNLGKNVWILSVIIAVFTCAYFIVSRSKQTSSSITDSKKQDIKETNHGWLLCLTILIIVYIVDLLTVSFVNTLPGENGGTGYYVDWLFWIGNAISFQKGLPVENFRLVGTQFSYHYFSSIIIAQMSLMTGMDVTKIAFYFSYIPVAMLMVFSAYILFSHFTENKVVLAGGIIALLFTGDIGVTAEWHYYLCPFGYDYGLAYGMLTVSYLLKSRTDGWKERDVVYTAILISILTGLKAPISVVVLVAFGLEFLWLITHRRFKLGTFAGVLWLGAFAVTYYVFIANPDRELTNSFYGVSAALEKNMMAQEVLVNLINVFRLPSSVAKVIAFVISVIVTNRFILLSFLIGIPVYLSRRSIRTYESLIVFLMTCTGLYMTAVLVMGGSSQMYFGMATLPYAICFSIPALEELYKSKRQIIKLTVGVALCFSFAFCMRYWEIRMEKLSWQGINTIEGNLTHGDYVNGEYQYAGFYVTKETAEACEWVKSNTEEESIVALHGGRGNMLIGVFSQRFVWNDGTYAFYTDEVSRRNDIVLLLDSEATIEEGVQKLREEGVSYYLTGAPDTVPSFVEGRLNRVYSNHALAVYKIE